MLHCAPPNCNTLFSPTTNPYVGMHDSIRDTTPTRRREGMNLHRPSIPSSPSSTDLAPSFSDDRSSLSGCSDHSSQSSLLAEFLETHSKVVRLHHLAPSALSFLSSAFSGYPGSVFGRPRGLWQARDGSIIVLFDRHDQACAALRSSFPVCSVAPVLERDVASYGHLKPLDVAPLSHQNSSPASFNIHRHSVPASPGHLSEKTMYLPSHTQDASGPIPSFVASGMVDPCYTISSNPPNPKNSFRLGDWICRSPICGVHNFGRNAFCRGCGTTRPIHASTLDSMRPGNLPSPRLPASPRFVGTSSAFTPSALGLSAVPMPPVSAVLSKPSVPAMAGRGPSPNYPLLTPSGGAFAAGGKVQNVSGDPLAPCVMFWPDNEPFPEQGQIRPVAVVTSQHPPILNTGNRGPIEHQPGDWVCRKCSYLNWRRRKVCQTCFPYAEGNGDSISATVQSERIALLSSVLEKQTIGSTPMSSPVSSHYPQQPVGPQRPQRSRTLPPNPILTHRSFVPQTAVHRARSHVDLAEHQAQPIYQTSGHYSSPTSPITENTSAYALSMEARATSVSLLPSFMNEFSDSPSLSPTSTCSADFSQEEFDDRFPSPPTAARNRLYGSDALKTATGSSTSLHGSNSIWGLDGEERKTFAGGFANRPSAWDVLSAGAF